MATTSLFKEEIDNKIDRMADWKSLKTVEEKFGYISSKISIINEKLSRNEKFRARAVKKNDSVKISYADGFKAKHLVVLKQYMDKHAELTEGAEKDKHDNTARSVSGVKDDWLIISEEDGDGFDYKIPKKGAATTAAERYGTYKNNMRVWEVTKALDSAMLEDDMVVLKKAEDATRIEDDWEVVEGLQDWQDIGADDS